MMTGRRLLILLVAVAVVAALVILRVRQPKAAAVPLAPPAGAFALSSPAFLPGGAVPQAYTGDGANVSPPLEWDNVPEGTVTFALVVDDPDASFGTFTHWLICDVPERTSSLPEGASSQGVEGENGFRKVGYGGPMPPAGVTHRYVFTLYALDEKLEMPPGYSKNQLKAAMKGHMLGEATLVGRYGR
jgi:hypothetical protein